MNGMEIKQNILYIYDRLAIRKPVSREKNNILSYTNLGSKRVGIYF